MHQAILFHLKSGIQETSCIGLQKNLNPDFPKISTSATSMENGMHEIFLCFVF